MMAEKCTVAKIVSGVEPYLKLAYEYVYPVCAYVYDILAKMVKQFKKDWDRVMVVTPEKKD